MKKLRPPHKGELLEFVRRKARINGDRKKDVPRLLGLLRKEGIKTTQYSVSSSWYRVRAEKKGRFERRVKRSRSAYGKGLDFLELFLNGLASQAVSHLGKVAQITKVVVRESQGVREDNRRLIMVIKEKTRSLKVSKRLNRQQAGQIRRLGRVLRKKSRRTYPNPRGERHVILTQKV